MASEIIPEAFRCETKVINMSTILVIFATAVITWFVTNELFYSPKAQIKRLWKEVFALTKELAKYNGKDSVADSVVREPYEKAIRKKKEMIRVLLDYHFDPEEDQEYIQKNTP